LVFWRCCGLRQQQDGIVAWVGLPEWIRGPASIVEGEVVLDEERADRYGLHDLGGAIFELATLRNPQDIRAFVRRHGLLLGGPDDLGTGRCREPLSGWQREAHQAALAVMLYMGLMEAERIGSAEPVRSLNITWKGAPETSDDEAYLQQQSMGLAGLISNHLRRCQPALAPAFQFEPDSGPGEFVITHQPPTLLAAIYADFAVIVAQRAQLKRCPGCGRIFHPESGRQKYHSKSCANNDRWRRWKERQAD
jgi:hypothetical protein